MGMKANVLRDALGNITVQMSGDFEYDNCMPIRDELKELASSNPNAQITVDLGAVDFVGSSGISHFVETVKLINKDKHKNNKLSVKNANQNFKRIFKLYTLDEAQMFWDEFVLPQTAPFQLLLNMRPP